MGQITLLTGDRRRRWSDEQKLAILQEAFASGARPADVARRYEISTGLLYTWRRKALAPEPGVSFVEAMVTPEALASADRPVIQVEFSAARVSIAGAASAALVSAVLKALR